MYFFQLCVIVSISLPINQQQLIIEYKIVMNRQEMQIYTQDHSHHGVNCRQILENYLNYVTICKDQHNIFRFMEEKAICTFLPAFWLAKASYLSEFGDYQGCFQCIQIAYSYTDEQEIQIMATLDQKLIEYRKKLIDNIRGFPLSSKRSVFQLNFQATLQAGKIGKQQQIELLKTYQTKYKGLKVEKQKKALVKREKLQPSWLQAYYEKFDSEKIHENSVRVSRDIKYHSMHTPIRVRDPQRLTKTMDSVQMLKKKRSTKQKNKKKGSEFDSDDSDQQNNVQRDNTNKMMNSLPVGKKFTNLKRRVTFQPDSLTRGQRNRNENSSVQKLQIEDQTQQKKQQKMDQESVEEAHIYSQPISKQ